MPHNPFAFLLSVLAAVSVWTVTPKWLASENMATWQKSKPIAIEWERLSFSVKQGTGFRRPQLPRSIRELEGKKVRLRGYIYPSVTRLHNIKQFLLIGEVKLLRGVRRGNDPSSMPLHLLVTVEMAAGKQARFHSKPVAVTGKFVIKPLRSNGKLYSVFHLVADSVVRVKYREGYSAAIRFDF